MMTMRKYGNDVRSCEGTIEVLREGRVGKYEDRDRKIYNRKVISFCLCSGVFV